MIINNISFGKRYVSYLKKIENSIIADLEGSSKSYIEDGDFFLHRQEPDRKEFNTDLNFAPDFGCSLTVGETYSITTCIDNTLSIILFIFKSNLGNDGYNLTLCVETKGQKTIYSTDAKKYAGHIFKFFIKLNDLVKKRYKIEIPGI